MNLYSKKVLPLLSFLLLPIISFCNPGWFALMEVQSYWPLIWLLPWTVIYGAQNGAICGLFLGIILDSVNNDIYTQIPGLVISGFWFGQLIKDKVKIISRSQYGLFASLTSFVCGLIYFAQVLYRNQSYDNSVFLISHGIKNIFAQVLLTGLIAPVFCFWLFLLFDNSKKLNN